MSATGVESARVAARVPLIEPPEGLVFLPALHIRVRVGVHGRDVVIRERSHEFRRDADDQRTVGEYLALGDKSAGAIRQSLPMTALL